MTRDQLPALCTVDQGCAFLGISRSTWYAREASGTLPTSRVVGAIGVRYDGDALRQLGTSADQTRRRRQAVVTMSKRRA